MRILGEASRGYLRRHSVPLATVGGLALLGIASTSAFHVVTGRSLGVEAFGLLASFLAIVNIAAIGASALQNSTAVATARALPAGGAEPRQRLDGPMVEALLLGGTGSLVVVLLAPVLADSLTTSRLAVYLAAATILPSFVFSCALGRLQGHGQARSISAWSTVQQLLRVLLAAACLAVGLGAVTVLLTVLMAVSLVATGATWQSRSLHLPSSVPALSRHSGVLIMLTLSFAWLTNIEVVLVRAGTPEVVSGAFAAAAVMAKILLLVPTTLSLYLLPRFVHREADAGAIRYGVNVVLGTVLVCGLGLALLVWLLGDTFVAVLFGDGYALAADLLPWMAVAYLPWALAQGLLIRLTASASVEALAVLVVSAVLQWVAASLLLPDVYLMIAAIGGIGVLATSALFVLHLRGRHQPAAAL